MARNKYPEQTIEKILDTSLRLFSIKTYEKTTIQDIVNELGMSKGAIYHHFKSKEEILSALGKRFYEDTTIFHEVKKRQDLNGIEKIRLLFQHQLTNQDKAEMDAVTLNIWKDPKFFMMEMKGNMSENVHILTPFLEEGIRDGSIREQDTRCASEVLLMLLNYWLLSPITGYEVDRLKDKIKYLRSLSDGLGIPVITDEIEQQAFAYFKRLATLI